MATPNTIAQLMILEFGGSTAISAHVTKVESFVNDAWKDLAREFDWPWLRAVENVITASGTAAYSLTTQPAEILGVRLTTGTADQEIIPQPVQWMQGTDLEITGVPTHYFLAGYDAATLKSKIQFWPTPNATLTIAVTYSLRPADLATGITIPIPEEFIPILKYKCRMLMSADDKDYEAVKLWAEIYRSEIQTAKIKYGYKPVGERAPKEIGR